MEVNIKALHFDITDKLVAFINKKIDKLTRRYEAVTGVDVTLKVVKPETAMNKEAGVQFNVPGNENLFASKQPTLSRRPSTSASTPLRNSFRVSKRRNKPTTRQPRAATEP